MKKGSEKIFLPSFLRRLLPSFKGIPCVLLAMLYFGNPIESFLNVTVPRLQLEMGNSPGGSSSRVKAEFLFQPHFLTFSHLISTELVWTASPELTVCELRIYTGRRNFRDVEEMPPFKISTFASYT